MRTGDPVLVSIARVPLRASDFLRLLPGMWINEEVVIAYGELQMKREAVWLAAEGRQRRVICFNPH